MTRLEGKGDSVEWVWCSPGFSPGADRVAGWLAFRNSIRRFFRVAPDFFILGAQKCGTTALYEVLRQHPELYLSPVKEPRHFIGDGRAPIFQGPGAEDFVRGGVWEPTAYAALFADARVGMRRGEASPVYLSSHRPDETAARIAAAAPRARLIVPRLDWVARWRGLLSWLDRLNRSRPRLSQAWRERLREEYREDGRRLKEILGGDFAPSWYD